MRLEEIERTIARHIIATVYKDQKRVCRSFFYQPKVPEKVKKMRYEKC